MVGATFLGAAFYDLHPAFLPEIAFIRIVERPTSGIIHSQLPQMSDFKSVFRLHIYSS